MGGQFAVPATRLGYDPLNGLLARRQRAVNARENQTVRCSAARGRAQARAAPAAFGQLVGMKRMQTGLLVHNTRV